MPVVPDGGVNFAPPRWAQRLAAAGHGILFLDEISTAPPAVQAALLRVVLERVVGDLELPVAIAVVAAANPPAQASDGWDLSAPLANRFCHLDWNADAAGFAQGIMAGWPKPPVPLLPSTWRERQVRTRGLVAAFVAARPPLLSEPPKDAAAAGRAWPSPRTWEMAASLMAAADEIGASDLSRALLVVGTVGAGAGIEFLHWISEMDLGDPEDALRDPAAFVLPERGDRAYAALSAVAAAVAANPTPERWVAGWKVLASAGPHAADVAAMAARVLARCRPRRHATARDQALCTPPQGGWASVRPLDGHKVMAARLWAAIRFPYLASALFATHMVPVQQTGVIAVDETWRLYVDPELLGAWTSAQLGSVVVHHVGHLLRDHAGRARTLGLGREQATRWVLAADAEINDDLEGAGLEFPIAPVTPQALGFEPHRFAEEYFRALAVGQSQEGGRAGAERGDDNRRLQLSAEATGEEEYFQALAVRQSQEGGQAGAERRDDTGHDIISGILYGRRAAGAAVAGPAGLAP